MLFHSRKQRSADSETTGWVRRGLAALSIAAVIGGGGALAATLPTVHAAAPNHDPVIMIPGMTGDVGNMDPMKENLRSNGWPADRLFTWTDSSKMTQDLAVAAKELGAKVNQVRQQTGANKVVLATWSASTLAARYYIKNLGGGDTVSQYISFAGPHHGTTFNHCKQYVSCQQFAAPNTPFLTALNSGTEVPHNDKVAYLTLRSSGDWNVAPTDSAKLEGADNRLLTSQTHFNIITDAQALKIMRDFIIAHEDDNPPTTTTPPTSTTTPPTSTTTPPVQPCFVDSNYKHVQAGRAHDNGGGRALANGSNQDMGLNVVSGTTKLRKTGDNYYVIDPACS
ncbi:esterase/lipase family protein [Nocardia suismassiliense]|uniref:Esterase/lipase family protein n=1 Tax=Nocardia suismassiliense TaxID=2077092 RepID=A0ABW6R0T1_9NOCA